MYIMSIHSSIKKQGIMHLGGKWVDHEINMQSILSQTEKNPMFSVLYHMQNLYLKKLYTYMKKNHFTYMYITKVESLLVYGFSLK